MARYCGGPRNLIDDTSQALKRDCLISDGSVLYPGETVWTMEHFEELDNKFVGNQIDDQQTFDQKLERQLADASQGSRRLFAELLLTYALFINGLLRPKSKRDLVALPLRFHGEELPADTRAVKALEQGIGNPGAGFSMRRPEELIYLIDMGLRLKALDSAERQRLLEDDAPWAFARWLDREVPGSDSRQMRHLLPHLLYPDHFERVGSGQHKRQIAQTFADLADGEFQNQDELLYAVRQRLGDLLQDQVENVQELDFYNPPLERAWRGTGSEELDTVEFKGQVVLYGPPGTGKTHVAKEMSEQLIRRSALRTFGAVEYFQRQDEVEEAVRTHVHRLQLHPAYSYEEFIRGLHLDENSRTVYRPGFLPQLVHQMATEPGQNLPHVVILDEMNRADLSRVFGEAFSLLENRGELIRLPRSSTGSSVNSEQDPAAGVNVDQLQVPENLYFIGTMNLIDQSVEQVDFALRRRFLWKPMRFDRDAMVQVLSDRWESKVPHIPWDRVEEEMLQLTENAGALNDSIHQTSQLGPQYEIGHTYYFDIVDLTVRSFGTSRGASQQTFLWKRDGKPRDPLNDLWRLSLAPLLEQYLAGLEVAEQDRLLQTFEDTFKAPPPRDE